MIQIVSFDVFDTVLTRTVGAPESIFLLLGKRLSQMALVSCTPEVFAHARIHAEQRAHQNFGVECTLEKIYSELGYALALNRGETFRLIEQEYAIEAEMIRVVPGALGRIQRARDLGRRVVFVSDMYLSSEFIRAQLTRHGLWKDGDRCYVSCEIGKSKMSGNLYSHLLTLEGIAAKDAIHQGNDMLSDVRAARQAGLTIEPYFDANLNRYEQQLESRAWETEGVSSIMAGASRLARLSIAASNQNQVALRDVVAGVAAPTLVGFTLWLLQRARQLGLTRLYFLSRDGQILLDIARRLAQTLNLSIELRYLYGSRQSWNLPAIIQGTDEELTWIWDTTDFLSARSLLNRIGLKPEQLQETLQSAGISDWNRTLTSDERLALRQVIQTDQVRALILEQSKAKRQVLLKYLEQEGLLESTAWGFVDLGWYGSMQNALAGILAEKGKPLVGFYFGLCKGTVVDQCVLQREAFFFDERLGIGHINTLPSLIALMEMFCVADHGTVVDFTEQGGRVEPVLKETANQKIIDWGLPIIRQTIACFIDNLVTDSTFMNPTVDFRNAIDDVLKSFWLHPSKVEAQTWGKFPWEDGLGRETYWKQLAQPYCWRDVFKSLMTGRIEMQHRSSWFQGTLALSSPSIRFAMNSLVRSFRLYRSYRYRLNARLRNLFDRSNRR